MAIAAKLKLGVETRPPEEQIAVAKAWFAERRTLLVLDDIWEKDVMELVPGPRSRCCARRAAVRFHGFRRLVRWIEKLLARRGGVDFPHVPRRGDD
jgi:hypothetical protein